VAKRHCRVAGKGGTACDNHSRAAISYAEEIRQAAFAKGQYAAAIAATKEIGVLSGLRIERREQGAPKEFEHLSDDELKAEIMRMITELGLVENGASTADVVPLRGCPKGGGPTVPSQATASASIRRDRTGRTASAAAIRG
jgi:hypothetical protein